MPNAPNYLRRYRKQTPLTLSDIEFLMDKPGLTMFSKYEKGHRTPTIEVLLVYHHLFNVSIEKFFDLQSRKIKAQLAKQILKMINQIKERDESRKQSEKVDFLQWTYSLITA